MCELIVPFELMDAQFHPVHTLAIFHLGCIVLSPRTHVASPVCCRIVEGIRIRFEKHRFDIALDDASQKGADAWIMPRSHRVRGDQRIIMINLGLENL